MKSLVGWHRLVVAIAWLAQPLFAQAQVSITTFHNDNSRTGLNPQEVILTPANVNSQQFGKLFSVNVDGFVYAQPLYVSGVSIAGGTHNVVYVATENDSIYAIDADNGTTYRMVNFIPAGGTVGTHLCQDIIPAYGITGTPVIDPASNTLYVVTNIMLAGGGVQFLHALDLSTLAEKFGGPVSIDAAVPGVATDGNGSNVFFDAAEALQRAGLLLENGHVVIGWSEHCDKSPFHGWVMSFSASSLALEGAFTTTPNSRQGGVWMAGGGLAADAAGNIYFSTGNGIWDGITEFSESIVKLGPPSNGRLPLLDYFTPWNQDYLSSNDLDVGSGAVMLLPPLANGRQLLTQQGKFSEVVLLDLSNLGGYCPGQTPACTSGDPNAYQSFTAGASLSGIWGAPAYWNGNVYYAGNMGPIRAYSFNANGSGLLSTSPVSQTPQSFTYFNPTPVITSNGNSNGILWAVDGSSGTSSCVQTATCLGLFAWNASDLSKLLYASNQTADGSTGPTVKFATPTVANGKVYVGTQSSLLVYGLSSGTPTAATPMFSPQPGSFASAQSVVLSDSTPGASIYYTVDGSTPGSGSPQYSQPIQVNATTTIQAVAVASGYNNSPIASASYTITGGTGSGGTQVAVSLTPAANLNGIVASGSAVPNGGIDGGGFALAANLLGSSLSWSGSVFTFGSAGSADAVWGKTLALPAGQYSTLKILGTGVNGNQPNQTFVVTYTDGSSTSFTQSISDWFYPQSYPGETMVLSMAYRLASNGTAGNGPCHLYGYALALNAAKTVSSIALPNNRNVVILAIDLVPVTGGSPTAAMPGFSPPPGSFSSAQSVTLSDSTPGAVIYYTTDGSTPGTGSARYSQSLAISATTNLQAIAVASGYSNRAISGGLYTINVSTPTTLTPGFAPPPGTYNAAQTVTLTDSTPGAVIYYSTDGSTPSATSARYTQPLSITSTTNLQAIAVASGYNNSAIGGGVYTISSGGGGGSVPVAVLFGGAANLIGIAANGSAVTGGGIDGGNFALSATLLGSSLSWSGSSFTFGTPGSANAVSAKTLSLPAGQYSSLQVLGTGVDGNQTSQTFVVTYTDGTSSSFTQSMSDWFAPQGYTNESTVLKMAYRINANGSTGSGPCYLYGYSFALNGAKTVQSVKLPASAHAVIIAIDLLPASGGGTLPTAATPAFSPPPGAYASATNVSLSDSTPGAVIYYTTNGATPGVSSAQYTQPLPINGSTTLQAIAVASGYTNSAVASGVGSSRVDLQACKLEYSIVSPK